MTIRYRKVIRLGPLAFNITRRGLTSVALRLGPFTQNLTTGRRTWNLPGGLSWTRGRKTQR